MRPSRVLILGASPFQLAPIRYAKAQGYHVITCDYLPANPGHRLADESHNVSTTDREAVLALARRLRIDGIVAHASDPAAPTAAYVAQALGLPGNPLHAVETLSFKDRYRDLQHAHGFHAPRHRCADSLESAQAALEALGLPVMVKPVDSSGSKGVGRVDTPGQLDAAYARALAYSRCGRVLLETWVERSGHQIAGDGYVRDGKLIFHCLAQEHFNPCAGRYTPVGESFPLRIAPPLLARVTAEIQRLIDRVGMREGALNFDVMIDTEDRVHLMEVAARSGGNLIPEVIRHATGVDLVPHIVEAALGRVPAPLVQQECRGHWAGVVVHAEREGRFEGLQLSPELDVVERHLFVQTGARVRVFEGTHNTLGMLILKFASHEAMMSAMSRMRELARVMLAPDLGPSASVQAGPR